MKEQEIIIRNMIPNDLDTVVQIENECFSTPWSRASLEEALQYKTHQFLVAEKDKKVIGYMGLIQTLTEADVTNIAVLQKVRNQGVASAIIQEMLKRIKHMGIETVFLEVRKSNKPAIHLYEKYGFEPLTVRKNYYQNPTEDAIVMSVELSTRKKE